MEGVVAEVVDDGTEEIWMGDDEFLLVCVVGGEVSAVGVVVV